MQVWFGYKKEDTFVLRDWFRCKRRGLLLYRNGQGLQEKFAYFHSIGLYIKENPVILRV